MIAIDGRHNYWRHLVIPFACSGDHDLTLNALLYVASLHIGLGRSSRGSLKLTNHWGTNGSPGFIHLCPRDPQALYALVLLKLKHFSAIDGCDANTKQSILMTILVLLVGSMVTGGPEFPFLYRMLDSAFDAIGGKQGLGDGEAADFVQIQVDK